MSCCSACEQEALHGFTADAQSAMMQNPEYFDRWDQWKTGLLVVALAALAYQVTRRPRRRRR